MVIVRMLKIRKCRHAPLGARPADPRWKRCRNAGTFRGKDHFYRVPYGFVRAAVEVRLTGIPADRPSGSVVVPIGLSL